MNGHGYEQDRLQCTATTATGKRCYRIGKYSQGGGVLCTEHNRLALVRKVNDKPLTKKGEK